MPLIVLQIIPSYEKGLLHLLGIRKTVFEK